ncbi:S8 family serine peptidase [Saliphagus sp. GCM10025308]
MSEDTSRHVNRRTVLRTAGATGAASLLPFSGTAAADTDTSVLDGLLDTASDALQEVIVVFDDAESVGLLGDLDLQAGLVEYEVLPMAYTALTGDQLTTVTDWDAVRRVSKAVELEFYNDDSREATGADVVQSDFGYDGSSVDTVVIDSGFSGPHPDFDGRLESNWQWVDDPLGDPDPDWIDLGAGADTDDLGHGTHCAGTVAGDGSASDGQYRGMAPGARVSVYSTNEAVYLPFVVGAWDHMLARADDPDDDFDPDVVSNSYGVARDVRYNPNDPVNVASWEAFRRGIVSVFAAGNDGPDSDTLSRFAKAPHVLGVAATRDDAHVTDFSSRGRTPDEDRETNYDRRTALRNLEKFHAAMTRGQYVVDTESWAGELGPTGTGSDYYEWVAPNNADVLELDLSLTPDGEQITLTVHRDSKDGEEVAKLGEEPVYQHQTLTTDVEGGETYWIEVEPATNVLVTYEIALEAFEQLGEPFRYRPVGLYRPGVATPGNAVMSTVGPTDALDALEPDEELYYSPMTGTSMACPAAAGICALVIDAARKNGHDWSPADVIYTVEAQARDAHTAYTPWNAGAGFVDAPSAVRRAAAGDFAKHNEVDLVDPDTPETLEVAGGREDDGSTFTAGQTNRVDVTVESVSHEAMVRDVVPVEWSVDDAYGDVERVEEDGDVQYVYFGTAVPGETATFTYFAEAPEETGTYTFGPGEANAAKTDDDWVAFGDADDNTVLGVET